MSRRRLASFTRCRLEHLEERAVPSRSIDVLDRGDFYRVNGTKVPLTRWANAVAVRIDAAEPQAVLNNLTAGPFTGFSVERPIGAKTWLLTSPASVAVGPTLALSSDDARIVKAETVPGVAWITDVFQNAESGTWMAATDQVIVALHENVNAATFFSGDTRFTDYRRLDGTPDQFSATLAEGAGPATLVMSEELLSDPRVRWATPDFYQNWQRFFVPNDPLYNTQWHLNQLNDADIDAQEAWDINQGGNPSVVVAIVDDGIEITHPDLQPNIFVNPGEIAGNGIDDDANGWIDDINGWDFTSPGTGGVIGDNDPGPSTTADEHGTSTAGVAAGRGNNSLGITGAAFNSRILPARIFEGASATSDAGISSAIYYSAGRKQNGVGTWNAATLTSNSWGGGALTQALIDSFTWAAVNGRGGKGVPSFIATGNGGTANVSSPAILSGSVPGVIAVGASTNGDVRSSYSQYGPQIDFVAPSNGGSLGITTTDRTGSLGYSTTDYTNTFGGTSSATPLAAGIGALIMAQDPNITAAAVRGLMRNTTDYIATTAYDPTTGFHIEYGYGRVNARTALLGIGKAEIQVLNVTTNIADGTGIIDFGTLNVGAALNKLVRIRNQGTLPLNLSNLTIPAGPFSIVGGFGKSTLNVGESTTFSVRFEPVTNGLVTQTITFTSNDADEGAFDFTVRGTGVRPSISGRVYEDWDADGTRNAGEPGIAGVVEFLDLNNNGVFDAGKSYPSSDVTKVIPNNGNVSSANSLSGLTGTITDVNVTLTINHTRDADLDVYLTSPFGTKVELFTDVGSTGDNFTNTTLDDQAAVLISAGTAPFTGTFRPEGSLAAFNLQNPNGMWILSITDDNASGTSGTLVSWSMAIGTTTGEISTTSDADGFYAFDGQPAGDYIVRRIAPAGFNATGTDSYSFNLPTSGSFVSDRDFGFVRQNTIYGRAFNDVNASGTFENGEPRLAGRTIYLDPNSNNTFDSKAFSNSTPVAIPDNNATGASSTIAVSGLGTVGAVRVKVNLTHTYDGDLELRLISPLGTSILLSDNRGDAGQNFVNTIFDDGAAITIAAGTAPFTGNFRPDVALSALAGQTANGTWTFKVSDIFAQDVGTILNWTLEILEPSATTDEFGQYRFSNLSAGAQRVRQVVPGGWTETAPVGGTHTVTVVAGQSNNNRDFGTNDGAANVTVTANQAATQPDPTNSPSINFTVVFSSSVSDFTNTDVQIGGTAGGTTAVVTGSGTTYNVAISGMTKNGTVSITLPAGVAGGNQASTSTDNVVIYDAIAPIATSTGLSDVTTAGGTSAKFEVQYNDDRAIKGASLGNGDVRVVGPNGFDVPVTLSSVNLPGDGTPRVVNYSFSAPGLTWDATDNGVYSLVVQNGEVTDTAGNAVAGVTLATFTVSIPPTVLGVQINDGNTQRSRITSMTVSFSHVVQLPATPADAFQLARTGPGTPTSNVNLAIDISGSTPTQTIAKLTFSGVLSEFASLIDGRYVLTVFGNQVQLGGTQLDGDNNGTAGGDLLFNLHRLFGDFDGDLDVDASDYGQFRTAFGTASIAFDFDNDNDVDIGDFGAFRGRFGATL